MGKAVDRELVALLEDDKMVPPLPGVFAQVVRLINEPNSSMQDLAKVIGTDPPLSLRVLRIVNSAYYGLSRKVTSLQLALTYLGMDEIKRIVTCMSVVTAFKDFRGSLEPREFWFHSGRCAHVAAGAARALQLAVMDEVFVAGLVHDAGLLILDKCFPKEFAEVAKKHPVAYHLPLKSEREACGAAHTEVGAWLAKKWELPPAIQEVMRFHHTPGAEMEYPIIVDLVRLADLFSVNCLDADPVEVGLMLANHDSFARLRAVSPASGEMHKSDFWEARKGDMDEAEQLLEEVLAASASDAKG